MSSPAHESGPGQRERLLLLLIAAVLAAGVVLLRGSFNAEAPLETMARRSPDLSVALKNGRPTLVEFYADWCQACRSMAPSMEQLEQQYQGQVDVVLLNVENPRWQTEIDRFEVNGIPQLELFNRAGESVGRSIGVRQPAELERLVEALVNDEPLPALAGVGTTSGLNTDRKAAPEVAPRSHS
jgi:thiol-disulfide isomerase/thioredoxin